MGGVAEALGVGVEAPWLEEEKKRINRRLERLALPAWRGRHIIPRSEPSIYIMHVQAFPLCTHGRAIPAPGFCRSDQAKTINDGLPMSFLVRV